MKRMIAIVLVILSMTTVLAGCSGTQVNPGSATDYNNGTSGTTVNPDPGYSSKPAPSPNTGAGTPSSSENGMVGDDRHDHTNNNAADEFADDRTDMAEDAGRAVQDAVDGRRSKSGTGMAGGR